MSTRPPSKDDSGGGWSDPGFSTEGDVLEPAEGPRYLLGAVLGQGGMGVVHAARDRALGRDVALKEVQAGLATDRVAHARLAREAAITGRLDHPGIVAVHDVGVLPDGRPYYTMRLVRGRTLAEAVRGTEAGERRTLLRHVLAAAEAVAAAHAAGMVHRDLKPANILVGAFGETQVADWGLAAPTPAAESRWAGLPGASARGPVGTERFMSPEQGQGAPPDPRDDVYSLGVTLREVIGEPVEPELAAIAARATASPAAARYPDAGALARDLLAWFDGRRVEAHAYSAGELLRRAVHANRRPITVGAIGTLGMAAAVAIGWAQTASALDRALHAEAQASVSLADLQLEGAVEATRAGQRERAERLALAVLEHRDDPEARGVFAAFGRAERPAMLAEAAGPECSWSVLSPGAAWVLCGSPEGLSRIQDGQTQWKHPGSLLGAEFHGNTVVAWDLTGALVALDSASGEWEGGWPRTGTDWVTINRARVFWTAEVPLDTVGLPASGCSGRLQVGATAPNGRFASLCDDGTLYLGDAADPGRLRVPTEAQGEQVATALAWKPDGGLLVGTVRGRVLDLDSEGRLVLSADTDLGLLSEIVVAPDGRHAALRGAGGRVALWRVDTAVLEGELEGNAQAMAFSDAGLVVHARSDNRAELHTWRRPAGAPAVFRGRTGLVDATASADGTLLALAGGDGFAAVVDLRDGTVRTGRMGSRVVKAAAFSPAGVWFAGLDAPLMALLGAHGGWAASLDATPLRRLAALSDGSLVGVSADAGIYTWPAHGEGPRTLVSSDTFIDMERDGDRLALLDNAGRVQRWAAGQLEVDPTPYAGTRAVALRGDSLYRATSESITDGTRTFAAPGASFIDIAVSLDGEHLAASALDGRVYTWSTSSGELLLVLSAHRERAVGVEFLPDGDLVSVSWDGTARVADLTAIRRPVSELGEAVAAAWGPR